MSKIDGVNHKNNKGQEVKLDIERVGVAMANSETVSRYGSANAEFIKGYRGIDNETGQKMAKGLAEISKHKVHSDPLEAAKNIKQQAGYSAEVAATSRDNARAIIDGSPIRMSRSDDLPPDDAVLELFHDLACPNFEQIKQNQIETFSLITLRNILLPKLLSGELNVSNLAVYPAPAIKSEEILDG